MNAGASRSALLGLLALILAPLLLLACGDPDPVASPTPSTSEVIEIIRTELAARPALTHEQIEQIIDEALTDLPQPDPGITAEQVDEAIRKALADLPQPQPALTPEQVMAIARAVVADIPLKSSPADFTRFIVNNALNRYRTYGLDSTLAHYNHPESADGPWYVFIIGEDRRVIAHPDPQRRGLDIRGWVGTDAHGYNFGKDMLSATPDGKWVSYVYWDPKVPGALEYKHVWVVRHDGLLFASGWYAPAGEFTRFFVDRAVAMYRDRGLEAALAFYNAPESVNAQWYLFIADAQGKLIAHYDPDRLGQDIRDLLGVDSLPASTEGAWFDHPDLNPATGRVEDKRFWVLPHDGLTFGSGWHPPHPDP